MAPTPRTALPCLGVVLRANHAIGTGHLMRVRSILPYLREHAYLRLYVYAFEENLKELCVGYDEVYTFATKEEILAHLLSLPQPPAPPHASPINSAAPTASVAVSAGAVPVAKVSAATQNSVTPCFNPSDKQEYLPQLILIDDYAIDRSFEELLFARCRLFVIDDLFNRPHCCHMLLDQGLNTHEQEYRKLCNPDCELLLGATYSLTLEEFYPQNRAAHLTCHCNCAGHQLPLSERVRKLTASEDAALRDRASEEHDAHGEQCAPRTQAAPRTQPLTLPRVFINFGGADPVSACLSVARTIMAGQLYRHYAFTLLAGAANKDYEDIAALVASIPEPFKSHFLLLRHCTDVADLFARHDVALGAYGGMFRERLASGLPTVGVIIADNQKGTDEVVERLKLGLNLPLSALSDITAVHRALEQVVARREEFTRHCLQVYDGHGLQRIMQKLLQLLQRTF
ncbi:MAG: hypothetical protein H9847_03330 [Candidatus Anaerobiospirillum pullicola]|uniref:UDP-2,4-diacetamido-2,4, 6-trideoxy-beta-L-altropyranose hydrolase n=1 Tax=Candidatus Anaerobiospirillum pullicola TaxID=2838451 RepID=A0A948TFG4_9GAMM|nr:hypothetical protein [Candidatus Anaerobiospirillum pullicola]